MYIAQSDSNREKSFKKAIKSSEMSDDLVLNTFRSWIRGVEMKISFIGTKKS
jgi:hypothetical protein